MLVTEKDEISVVISHRFDTLLLSLDITDSSELEKLLEHTTKHPTHSVIQTICQLGMFNKFSDGLSGLKTYVNSPALGRNQVSTWCVTCCV